MALKLSVFTTVTDPYRRGDNAKVALECYSELADEVVVVNGGSKSVRFNPKIVEVYSRWPYTFSWPLIGKQFQKGYEKATGDWVIHADLDFLFHQDDFENIRKAMEQNLEAPALSFWKYQFIQPKSYNLKSRLVIAVNKAKFGDRIRFDSGGDLCQPSLDGNEIKPDQVPEARVPFYNYEKLSKTREQIADDVVRMDYAYHKHFGKWLYSTDGTKESALQGWFRMVRGRYTKPQTPVNTQDHPRYIQPTISNLKPEQFGHSGLGEL